MAPAIVIDFYRGSRSDLGPGYGCGFDGLIILHPLWRTKLIHYLEITVFALRQHISYALSFLGRIEYGGDGKVVPWRDVRGAILENGANCPVRRSGRHVPSEESAVGIEA